MPTSLLTRLESYDYHLPEKLIAQQPANPRDSSRLLVLDRKTGRWEHRTFRDLPEYLGPSDLLIANNTQVFKARLVGQRVRFENGRKTLGGRVEFVMLEELGPRTWEGLFHASAKYLPGLTFEVPLRTGGSLQGRLIRGSAESPSGAVVVEFDQDPVQIGAGEIPLPHYIKRPVAQFEDEGNYQTIYSKNIGSAAAPTAGLHFTDSVMEQIRTRGAQWKEVTLHVGVGTFRPVKVADIREHIMHEERYEIPTDVAEAVNQRKATGKRILAVGTTSVRTLEGAWKADTGLTPGLGRTSIFIRPGEYEFQVVDRLLTNFHLPKSTLLMLVAAFAGRELVLDAYKDAVHEGYRFFSYGDAMLVI